MLTNPDNENQLKISETLTQTTETCHSGCCRIFICERTGVRIEVPEQCLEAALQGETIGACCVNFELKDNLYKCKINNNSCPNVRATKL